MTTEEVQKALEGIKSIGDATIGSLKKHSVADVIKAGTYQGFTDEEIQAVVDFYVNLAHRDEEAKAYTAAYITQTNETIEKLSAYYDETKARLEQAVSLPKARGIIGEDGFPVDDATEGGDSE